MISSNEQREFNTMVMNTCVDQRTYVTQLIEQQIKVESNKFS